MPQTLEPLRGAPEPAPNRIRWTRAQCRAIREAGVLTGRYELIDGEIISKMGQNPPHATAVGLLQDFLSEAFGSTFVRVQLAIQGNVDPEHNEPEPDLAVTRLPRKEFSGRHPGPEDLLLVAEVSDSTLRFDRMTKGALYARAGITGCWTWPAGGSWSTAALRATRRSRPTWPRRSVAPLARPECAARVADLLP